MSILINKDSRVLVQAITGKSGSLQTKVMLEAGTNIVAGVTPGKSGQEVYGVPVYDYISEAKAEHEFVYSDLFCAAGRSEGRLF